MPENATERLRTLELALREARRFANAVVLQCETVPVALRQEALRQQDAADKALGYCGCPDCAAARDALAAAV